jgi:hydrogenase nickel incorporation protein HypA/HybF
MHEVHLVESIIETVEKKAKAKAVKKVNSIKIRFNALTSHSADHVRFSFELAKRDKPLFKETRLDLNELEPLLRCIPCSRTFLGAHLPEVCPHCGSLDVSAINSTDLVLESFEMEN